MANEFVARNGLISQNNTTITGSLQQGLSSQAIGNYSHAEGTDTKTGIQTALITDNRFPITNGLVTIDAGYGDVTTKFTRDGYLYLYDDEFDKIYRWASFKISNTLFFDGTNTLVQLVDTSVTTTTAYVGDLTYLQNNGTFGGDKTIPGPYAHAEGIQTKAIGDYSHAEGDQSQALGGSSHSEGERSQAIGTYSHAEGSETQAIGEGSHAEGQSTRVLGNYSHAEGVSTIASGDYQHVQGQYNIISSEQSAFIIGNGADDNNRSNLLYAAGNIVQITGSLRVSGSITGSLFGTASFAQTASFAPNYVLTSATSSMTVISSSFATTASFAPAYLPIAVPQTTGLVISFTQDRVYGTFASPETGSAITSNTASAILGVTNLIIHSASSAPTTGSDFKKLTGSSDYVAGLNYIYCTYIANNQIIYSISQAT
jgi:hypothetical protein